MKNLLDKVTEYFSNVSDEELDSLLKETEEYRDVYPYAKDFLSGFELTEIDDNYYFESNDCFHSEGCTESVSSEYSCSYSDVEPHYNMAA